MVCGADAKPSGLIGWLAVGGLVPPLGTDSSPAYPPSGPAVVGARVPTSGAFIVCRPSLHHIAQSTLRTYSKDSRRINVNVYSLKPGPIGTPSSQMGPARIALCITNGSPASVFGNQRNDIVASPFCKNRLARTVRCGLPVRNYFVPCADLKEIWSLCDLVAGDRGLVPAKDA